MYAYKTVGSENFRTHSIEIYGIKSGLTPENKIDYYPSYTRWLSDIIMDVINGQIHFAIAYSDNKAVAYISFVYGNHIVYVKEIRSANVFNEQREIFCGMLSHIVNNFKTDEKIEYIVFNNGGGAAPLCEFLKPCDVNGNECRYSIRTEFFNK